MRTRARPPAPATGAHQPGILTRQPPHLALVAFDVVTDRRDELAALLSAWSAAAARLAAEPSGPELTFGLGDGLFAPGRFRLDARRPVGLAPLPPFAGDALDEARCGGDLCVQVGASEPGALVAALAMLAAAARGVAVIRWTQVGFRGGGRRPDGRPRVPRDLLGFLEGADNLRFPRQERVVGRRRTTGAELMPENGHVALAAPRDGEGGMLRRGFNYVDAAAVPPAARAGGFVGERLLAPSMR